MKTMIMRVGVFMMKILYVPMKLLRVKNRITFISRQSDKPSSDISMLAEQIKKMHPEIECRIMSRMLRATPAGLLSYLVHMLKQMHALSTSKVIVLDGYCITACILEHKSETSVVQMWHSLAAIKKFGYQTIDMPAGHSRQVAETMHMHENYDYILCPSRATGRLFCRAMNSDEKKLVYLGLPRIDVIKREDKVIADRIRKDYGLSTEKKILLYAPTFRKGETIHVEELANAIDSGIYQLVVKLHPVYEDSGIIPKGVIQDRKYSSYEWFNVCDGVITDYSALGVEATLTDKPVYFYLYDLKDYSNKVGINVNPMEEMASVSATDAVTLAEIIEKQYDYVHMRKFREKYVSVDTNNCTEKLADFIVSLSE